MGKCSSALCTNLSICIITLGIFPFSQFSFGQGNRLNNFPKTPFYHSFFPEDFEGGLQTWDIVEGKNGVIYAANNSGLLEFDGTFWINRPLEGNTRLTSLLYHPSEKLFVGGQNLIGYFDLADRSSSNSFHSLNHLLPDNIQALDVVWHIISFDSLIVFNTITHCIIYDFKKLSTVPFPIDGGYMFTPDSVVLAHSPSDGLLELTPLGFEKISSDTKVLTGSVMSILNINNERVLLMSDGSLFKQNEKSITQLNIKENKTLVRALINCAIKMKNGDIAVGTQNDGLFIFNSQFDLIQHFSIQNGLLGRSVHAILEDRFGNLWVGLHNGISYLEMGSPFQLINETVGVWGTGYTSLPAKEGLILGTNNGLFINKTKINGPKNSQITENFSIIENSEGQVWNAFHFGKEIGVGHHTGGYFLKNNVLEPIISEGTWLWKPIPTRDGEFIAGTYSGFYRTDGKTYARKIEGFSESSRVFEFENDSTVWMTHGYKGVYKLEFDKKFEKVEEISFYGDQKGFPSNLLINVFRLEKELIFAASYGLYQYQSSSDLFVPNDALNALIGQTKHVSQIKSSSNGDVYYIADGELGLLRKRGFNQYEKIENPFFGIHKHISDDLENFTILPDQSLLLDSKEGFIFYDNSKAKTPTEPFYTILRHLVCYSYDSTLIKSSYNTQKLVLGVLKNKISHIRFDFSSPYFDGYKDLQYQVFLENFDKNWSEWSKNTHKEYTNLPYGNYTFYVRARNKYNQLSDACLVTFSVPAPWYATTLAMYFYVGFVVIFFSIILFTVDRGHRKEKIEIKNKSLEEIEQRDIELVAVKENTTQTINHLKNEKLRAEIDHKKRELASTAMHLVNKNQFLEGIKSKLEVLVKNHQIAPDEIKKLIRTIDKNIEDEKSWDQFARHFDQVHGDFLNKLKTSYPKLTPQESRLAAYLRMNMSSKEISQLLNISIRGVEISRYRLRKKLGLSRDTHLIDFFTEL